MAKRALISVYDKTGVVELAKELSALKYEIVSTEKNNASKDKKFTINPFVFNFSMDFVSKISAFYVEEFLILLISALKDGTITNRNLFYSEKIFFPNCKIHALCKKCIKNYYEDRFENNNFSLK